MNQLIITILVFCCFIFYQGCASFFIDKDISFITVRDKHFYLNDKPYYFLGTNLWYGCYIGSPGETGDRERLINELDSLKAIGIMNLRILAASESTAIEHTLKPSIQNKPGEYNEQLLDGLDFLLSEMRKREMHAVVFLNNYWEWSGGMAQYNTWTNNGKIVNPYDSSQGWGAFMQYSAEFYKNARGNEIFRDYIKMILTRKNGYTGTYYYEDPSIMSWQLANEPRPGKSAGDDIVYKQWIDSTAAFIHAIDPNHLVSTGSEGIIGSLGSEYGYIDAHSSRYIDYLTLHLWVKNWGWYDPMNHNKTYAEAEQNAVDYIIRHIEIADSLNKPLVLEEFGITRDNQEYDVSSSVDIRDTYYTRIFDLIHSSASSGSAAAGCNFWAWGGIGRAANNTYIWQKDDPFTGDPPHEPQGIYSVFDSDTSTINIIRSYSVKMQQLRFKE